MLIRRTLPEVVGWWKDVATRRFNLSSARIVGRLMSAIVADFQEARLSLALTMGCRKWFFFSLCPVVSESVSSFGYRDPNNVTCFRLNPFTMIMR